MTGKRLLILLAIVIACKPAPKETKPGAGPQVAATVVTIRTTIGSKTTSHELVIANGRARSTAEHDVWRLFDTKAGTVTFVDEIDRTIRTESFESLVQKRRQTLASAIPAHYPMAELSRGASKPLLGVSAQQHVIETGAHRRELWLARHGAIPENLFAMMVASDAPSSPLAPMMRTVDEELLRAQGFPLADRSEVPLGAGAYVVERTVVSIASRQVPEAMLAWPRDYRDVTPKREPSKSKAATR